MSAKTRRRKTGASSPSHPQPAGQAAVSSSAPVPMPKWQWRTFPVYFAFAAGGFLGVYMGVLAGAAADRGNNTVWLVVFGFWAVLLGFGFSRLTSRWLISHNWGPAARRARKR